MAHGSLDKNASTTSDYPDLNTPLNVKKQSGEPGADVQAPVPGDTGDGPSDPMGYMPKKGKK